MYSTIKKAIWVGLCLLTFALPQSASAEGRTHLVMPSQTLYSISKLYGVSIESIQKANPGVVEGTHVPAGATIVIPDGEPESPAPATVSQVASEAASTVVEQVRSVSERVSQWLGNILPGYGNSQQVTLSVILPFNLSSHNTSEDKMQMRSVEFYQGMLVAVNRAQINGMNIQVQAYDLGTETLDQILTHPELAQSDLIIAPMEAKMVREVALYGESHDINVFSPFTLVPDMTAQCRHLFQLNTYVSELYPELSAELKSRFDDYAFVFVTDSLFVETRDPFTAFFKEDLKRSGIVYYEYMYGSPQSVMAMDTVLNLSSSNLMIIPESTQRPALRRLFPSLKNKRFLEEHPEVAFAALAATDPEKAEKLEKERQRAARQALADSLPTGPRKTAILGYPEWQLYTSDFMDDFYDMNVWMFSKFYVDPFDPEVTDVYNQFRYWYAREMMPLYPKYGMLGYDVAMYALRMLGEYGHNFDAEAEGKYMKTLQSAMLFRREGEGGFLNKSLYLVHFTPEARIEKFEIK